MPLLREFEFCALTRLHAIEISSKQFLLCSKVIDLAAHNLLKKFRQELVVVKIFTFFFFFQRTLRCHDGEP